VYLKQTSVTHFLTVIKHTFYFITTVLVDVIIRVIKGLDMCCSLTQQLGTKHQTAAHSPFPLPFTREKWTNGKTHGLR